MKRKIVTMLLSIASLVFVAPVQTGDRNFLKTVAATVQEEVDVPTVIVVDSTKDKEEKIDTRELVKNELDQIDLLDSEKEKIIKFNEFLEKYEDIIDPPEDLLSVFSYEELDKLYRVVEAEATAGEFIDKANVASVIFNRILCDDIFDTSELSEILTEKQFSSIKDGRYQKVDITEDTVLACEYVFIFGSTVEDAQFFDATNGDSWAYRNREQVTNVEDNIGHMFFR